MHIFIILYKKTITKITFHVECTLFYYTNCTVDYFEHLQMHKALILLLFLHFPSCYHKLVGKYMYSSVFHVILSLLNYRY